MSHHIRTVPCPQHGGKGSPAGIGVLRHRRKRPQSPAPGEPERRFQRRLARLLPYRAAVFLRYSRHAKRIGDPARAKSAPLERSGTRGGERAIVNVTAVRETLHQLLDVRSIASAPSPLLDFSREIGAKARAGRCIAAGIKEGELLELLPVQRRTGSFPGWAVHAP